MRTSFYVVHASQEENQNGIFHFSDRLAKVSDAIKLAASIKDDFVNVEKHPEVWEGNEWRVNHEAGGIEVIDWY